MKLKELIIDWLTESRYIRALERFHIEQRQDFETRLSEKDEQIKSLRTEIAALKAESDRMRAILLPLGAVAGQKYAAQYAEPKKPALVPAFSAPDDWASELTLMLEKEEKHGVPDLGRVQEHQSGADDGAQAVNGAQVDGRRRSN